MKMAWADGSGPGPGDQHRRRAVGVQGICSHEYFELDKGFLTAGTLTCALHLSRFDLDSGEPLDPAGGAAAGASTRSWSRAAGSLIEVPDGPLEVFG